MKKSDIWLQYAPMSVAGVAIVALGVMYHQPFYKMLPMLNTLVIMLLSANANRYSFLFGGLNAVLYGVVYFSEHIYFSAISAVLISFPMQIFSFFYWNRRTTGASTRLARMRWRGWAIVIGSLVAGYAICYWLLLPFFLDAAFPWLDIFTFVLGIVITVMVSLCYVESQYLNVVNCTLGLVLWFMISSQNVSNINYLVIGCYNLFRVTQASVVWTKKYREGTF